MVNSVRLSILLTLVLFIGCSALMAEVTISTLQNEISKRLERVAEFKRMKEIAQEIGVKEVYLFGGSASAWAHYVYLDLLREDGDTHYQPDRFNYHYTTIFRSNQDMDIVIDGTAEQAAKIEAVMSEEFGYFQGKKSVFEVRLRNQTRGDKDALSDPHFLNQNTDSHSTGLIEVFGDGKNTVQDVKDPHSTKPQFLKDVYKRELHYYYNHEKHIKTKRYLEGKNPEILSVIRYFTKAFQYELSIDKVSEENLNAVIKDFDPAEIRKLNPYVASWLEHHAPKLYQNAVNLEFARNTLDHFHLREKLMEVNNDALKEGSLAWWMNKDPLRSFPLGAGEGRTAKELGIDIVAHETNSFEAFESITKAHTGDPNVFKSRTGAAGEQAAFGEGLYTAIGKKGARGTGLTVRAHLHPEAREGRDFILVRKDRVQDGDFVLVFNKKAVRVIPESLKLSPVEYFQMVSENKLIYDFSDRAVVEKMRKMVGVSVAHLSQKDKELIRKIFDPQNEKLVKEFIELAPELIPASPELVKMLIQKNMFSTFSSETQKNSINRFFARSFGKTLPPIDLVKSAMTNYSQQLLVSFYLDHVSNKEAFESVKEIVLRSYPDLMLKVITNSKLNIFLSTDEKHAIINRLIMSSDARDIYEFGGGRNSTESISTSSEIYRFLADPVSLSYEDFFKDVAKRVKSSSLFISLFTSHPDWVNNSSFFDELLKLDSSFNYSYKTLLYSKNPDLYGDKLVKELLEADAIAGNVSEIFLRGSNYFITDKNWLPYLEKYLISPRQRPLDSEFVKVLLAPEMRSLEKYLAIDAEITHMANYYRSHIQRLRSDFYLRHPEVFKKHVKQLSSLGNELGQVITDTVLPHNAPLAQELFEDVILETNFHYGLFTVMFSDKSSPNQKLLPQGVTTLDQLRATFKARRFARSSLLENKSQWATLLAGEVLQGESNSWMSELFKSWKKLTLQDEQLLLEYLKNYASLDTLRKVLPVAISTGKEQFINFARSWAGQFGSDSRYEESFKTGEIIRGSLSGNHHKEVSSCLEVIKNFL